VMRVLESCSTLGGRGPCGRRTLKEYQELDLLDDEATADVSFLVEGKQVVAHMPVLQRFSPALARVCSETTQRPVQLKNVSHAAFRLVLEHVYSRFTKPLIPVDAEILLQAAHQFELKTLVRRCQQSIVIDALNVRHFLTVALAIKPPLELLNQKCIEYLISHPEHQTLLKGPKQNIGSGPASPDHAQDGGTLHDVPCSASDGSMLLSTRGASTELQPQWQPLRDPPVTKTTLPLSSARSHMQLPFWAQTEVGEQHCRGRPWLSLERNISGNPPICQLESRYHVFAAPQVHSQHASTPAIASALGAPVPAQTSDAATKKQSLKPTTARSSWMAPQVLQAPQHPWHSPYIIARPSQ